MKKRTLFFYVLFALLANNIFGQPWQNDLETQVEEALSTLDYNEVSTGILYEKIPTYYPLHYNDGTYIADSISVIEENFLIMYGMIDKAHTGISPMMPVADFLDLSKTLAADETNIHLSLLHYRYNRFKEYALDQNLITFQNDHFYDVVNRPESPYSENTLFAATTLRHETTEKEVSFLLESNHIFSNITPSPGNLEINFDDGNGWTDLLVNHPINVVYPDTGLYRIKIRMQVSAGAPLVSQTLLLVKENPLSSFDDSEGRGPDGYSNEPDSKVLIGNITETPIYEDDELLGYSTTHDGVEVYWWYGECHEEILKPLIIIEGFDPSNSISYDKLFEEEYGLLVKDYDFPDNITLTDKLFAAGYDIFFINYTDGGADIWENAVHVKEAIEWINEHKSAEAEENIVIGASMGGVMGKIVLRQMEQAGEDHDTRLYMSFDAPLKGANVPLGLQSFVTDLAQTKVFGIPLRNIKDELANGEKALTSPAAKQLLYYHVKACPNINCDASEYTSWHDEFYTNFEALGDLDISHIAIANGSINNENQLFGAGYKLLSENITQTGSETWYNYLWIVHALSITVDVWALPGYQNKVYDKTMFHMVLGIPFYSFGHRKIFNPINYDHAPGGIRPFNEVEDGVEIKSVNWKEKNFCFIPTISALGLDITDPFYPGIDLTDVQTITENGSTYINSYVGATETYTHSVFSDDDSYVNMDHVSLDNQSANFLLSKFLSAPGPDATLSSITDIYNYGEAPANYIFPLDAFVSGVTPHTISYSIFIENDAEIWVNRSGRIAQVNNPDNPDNATMTHFKLNVLPGCNEESVVVSVTNSGKFIVGEWSNGIENTAEVNVHENAAFLISNLGKLSINHQSELSLHNGSNIAVKNGGTLEALHGGSINIKDGGELRIEAGGTLKVHGASQLKVEPGGKLIIEQGAIVQLWDGNDVFGDAIIDVFGTLEVQGKFKFSGNGYFKFEVDNTLTLSGGNIFQLSGDPNATQLTRFIEIADNAKLNFQSGTLSLHKGIVQYGSSALVQGKQGAKFIMSEVDFRGENDATALSAFEGASQFTISQCMFSGFETAIEAYNTLTPLFLIEKSLFQNNKSSLFVQNSGMIRVSASIFQGTSPGDQAILLDNVSSFRLLESRVQNYTLPLNGNQDNWGAIVLNYDVPEFVMSGGAITNNEGAGIYCPAGYRSNVFLRNQATISNNDIGIHIAQGATSNDALDYGLILMDCANLLNNSVGIKGQDILLQIDAYDNLGDNDITYLRPNHFQNTDLGNLFEICYDIRDEAGVSARGNYWGTDNANIETVSQTSYHLLQNSNIGNGCVGYYPNIPLDVNDKVLSEPTACPIAPEVPDNPDPGFGHACVIAVGTPNEVVAHEEYAVAYRTFDGKLATEEETGGIKYMFAEMSAVDDTERNQASEACKQYIDVSRVMTSAEVMKYQITGNNSNYSQPMSTSTYNTQNQLALIPGKDHGIKLFPNPAKNYFQISIPASENHYQIDIFNSLGHKVITTHTIESIEIKTSSWTPGLYHVLLTNERSGEIIVLKVIAQ